MCSARLNIGNIDEIIFRNLAYLNCLKLSTFFSLLINNKSNRYWDILDILANDI